jgi:ABC-type Mn2+/Zn2+ transport system permease subunit
VDWLIGPVRDFEFFRNGAVALVLAGLLTGVVGVYVVLRRMSYIGHGLSHAIFGGAVVAFALDANFYLGAGLWGLLSALLINTIARRRKVGADAAIGIVTTASFALGVALISRVGRFTLSFDAVLFGNVLAVRPLDVAVIAAVTGVVLGAIVLAYRPLLFVTFDPEVAETYGVASRRYDTLFAILLASTVIATMQALGVTLIAAAIVIPATAARLLTDSFGRILVLAGGFGAATGLVGMYASFYADISSGPAVVLTQALLFTLVFGGTALMARRRLSRLRRGRPRSGAAVGGPAPDLG